MLEIDYQIVQRVERYYEYTQELADKFEIALFIVLHSLNESTIDHLNITREKEEAEVVAEEVKLQIDLLLADAGEEVLENGVLELVNAIRDSMNYPSKYNMKSLKEIQSIEDLYQVDLAILEYLLLFTNHEEQVGWVSYE